MSIPTNLVKCLSLLALVSGCGDAFTVETAGSDPVGDTVEEALQQRQTFAIRATDRDARSDALMVASGIWIEESPATFQLEVAGGEADLRLNDEGQVELFGFEVQLAGFDHTVPGGAHFTDMALVLEDAVVLETSSADSLVSSHGALDLRLDWSLSTDTATTPLASQAVESLPVELTVEDDGSGLQLIARLHDRGLVFELPGLFAVEEIDVNTAARPD